MDVVDEAGAGAEAEAQVGVLVALVRGKHTRNNKGMAGEVSARELVLMSFLVGMAVRGWGGVVGRVARGVPFLLLGGGRGILSERGLGLRRLRRMGMGLC